MIYYLLTTLYVLVCFGMMLVVYLQQGKGGDIASAFGGASSQTAFGARSGATVLSRATWICAALFIVVALVLGMMGRGGSGSSVLGGRTPLTQPVPGSAAPTPAQKAPAPTAPAQPAQK